MQSLSDAPTVVAMPLFSRDPLDLWAMAAVETMATLAKNTNLRPKNTLLSISLGDPVTSGKAYQAGYRGPSTAQGKKMLEVLRTTIWRDRTGGCGPWADVVKNRPYKGWMVYGNLGAVYGSTQVWVLGPYGTSLEFNAAVPSPTVWVRNPKLRSLPLTDAVTLMLTYDVFRRQDGMSADQALNAALALR